MKLPQLAYPIYEVSLLSQKQPVKIRPFTVREEKLMLMAAEAKDIDTIINTLKQIISNCVIGEFDVDNMAMVDLETMFLHLRARSIGEVGQQVFKCTNEIDDAKKPCGMLINVPINFLQIPIVNANTDLNIKLSDEIGLKMKFPTFSLVKLLGNPPANTDLETIIAASCIDVIYNQESVYHAKDCTLDEMIEFVLNLPSDKYQRIENFCENVPKTQLVVAKKCAKCGYDHTFTLEGIGDFFV